MTAKIIVKDGGVHIIELLVVEGGNGFAKELSVLHGLPVVRNVPKKEVDTYR